MNGYSAIGFLLTLAVLIVVHEWGHYKMARLCGVKVLRFSVGFGRALWTRRRGDTEFVIGAIPLGGYVKMLDEREGGVAPHEQGQAFNRKPLRQRVAIVAAGPIANLLLAVLVYACTAWIGAVEPRALLSAPTPGSLAERAGLRSGELATAVAREAADGSAGDWQDLRSMVDLRWQIMRAALDGERLRVMLSDGRSPTGRSVTLELDRADRKSIDARFIDDVVGLGAPWAEAVIGDPVIGGPADKAGLKKGDRVRRINGVAVADAAQLRARIRAAVDGGAARPLAFDIERQGQALEIVVQPRVVAEGERRIGRIDAIVGAPPEMVTVRYGAADGLWRGVTTTWSQSVLTVKMFGRMLIGEASLKNLTGPVTIADYAGRALERGLVYYLGLLAAVSVGIGVLNLMPVPLLDGGHLMYYLFEGLTGRPVPDAWLVWLQRAGALALMMLMTLALFNDLAPRLGLY
ncbi:MAG TPA: RIP metalloprotease RseP [Burkholderiaceae bacterium]|nr:RIP metalloprotease RseP [Burkholderiaceae bacterium]